MFVPVVHARASMGDQSIGTDANVILVNRLYLRGVDQVDAATASGPSRSPAWTLADDVADDVEGAET